MEPLGYSVGTPPLLQRSPMRHETTRYDLLRYRTHAHAAAHPDRLAAIAALHGIRPPGGDAPRVLEIGCGDGGHLLPMADAMPSGRFVGIDLAADAIAAAEARAVAAAVSNARFLVADVRDIPGDLGQFHFVIAHGMYSWLPDAARDALLAMLARHLAPEGIGFVSYATLPGGHLRQMVRGILCLHAGLLPGPEQQVRESRALIELLTREADCEDAGNAAMRAELRETAKRTDQAIAHDDLSPDFAPVWLHEFIAHLAANDLRFVAEAEPAVSGDAGFSAATRAVLSTLDGLAREQYRDLLRCRRFRQSLVCHARVAVAHEPLPEAVDRLHLAPSGPWAEELMQPGIANADAAHGALTPDARRVVESVRDAWPMTTAFEDLLARGVARDDARRLVLDAATAGIVALTTRRGRAIAKAGVHPRVTALARKQARDQDSVVNLYHAPVRIADASILALIASLDGRRDRASLAAELGCSVEQVDIRLDALARLAMLVA
jgi:SAM-dependent methyltransferase